MKYQILKHCKQISKDDLQRCATKENTKWKTNVHVGMRYLVSKKNIFSDHLSKYHTVFFTYVHIVVGENMANLLFSIQGCN